jgi:hypothetical protein
MSVTDRRASLATVALTILTAPLGFRRRRGMWAGVFRDYFEGHYGGAA